MPKFRPLSRLAEAELGAAEMAARSVLVIVRKFGDQQWAQDVAQVIADQLVLMRDEAMRRNQERREGKRRGD